MMRKYLSVLVAIVVLISATCAAAETQYEHPETGYIAIVWDDAELLTDEEEERLLEVMNPITAYGHAVFSSDTNNGGERTSDLAESVLRSVCARFESGTIFEIDMDNRMLYIFSDGAIYDIVTKSYADTITDNVYRYATDGRYFDCASEAFRQILRLLEGQSISQPMKHINNALLALALGIFLNFFVLTVKTKKNDRKAAQGAIVYQGRISNLKVVAGELKRVYAPKKSGSSRGGGGGGGRSGGGGGHRF